MTNRSRLATWVFLNGIGMALAFLTFLHVLFALAFGLDFERYWSQSAVEDLENAEQVMRLGLVIGLPLAGAVFTSVQATFLRRYAVDLRSWILAGPLGFVLPLLVIWPLTAIWGDIPGPVEPFTIVAGGLVGTAVFQWLALRRRGIESKRWLILWCVGLPLGMVAFMLGYLLLDTVASIGWAAEVALIGFAIGGGAAAVSGTALLGTISVTPSSPAVPPPPA